MNQHQVNIDNACLASKEQCKPLMDVGNLADLFFKLYPKPEQNILSSDFKKLVQNVHSPTTSAEPNNDDGDVTKIPAPVYNCVQEPTTSALSKNLLGGGLNMVATERNSDNDNGSGSMIQLPAKKGGTLKIKNLNEGVGAGLMTNSVNDNNMTMPLALIDPSINMKKLNSVTLTSTPPNVGIAKSNELLKKTLNSNETATNLKTTIFTPTKLFCSTVTSEMVNNSENATATALMVTTPKPGEVAMPTGGLLCPSTTYTVQSVLNSKVSLGISSPTLTNPVPTVLTSSAQQLLSNNVTPSTITITTTPTNSTNSTASNSPAIRPVPLSHLTNPQTVAFAAALQKHLQAQEMLRYQTDAILNRQTAGRILETMLLNHQQENTSAGGGGGSESLPSNDNNEDESFKEDEEDLNNGSELTNDDSQMTSFDDIHLMENVLEAAKNLPQLPPNAINLMPSTSANGSGSNCSTLYSLTDESRKYLNLAVQKQAQAQAQVPVPNLQVRENFLDLSINAVAAAAAAAQSSSTSRSRARNRTDSQTEDGGELQKYVCSFCGKMYRWKSTLRRHINVECGGKLPLNTCPYCPYKSKQAGNLGVHVRKHHPDKEPLASKRRSKYSRLATRSPSAHTSSNPPTPPTNSNGDATSEDSGILSNESSK